MSDSTPEPTSVYRYYDKFGLLLYVGVTGRGAARNAEHNSTKSWWPFVIRQEIDHHLTRPKALAAERGLIQHFRPPFNTQHNPGSAEIRKAYLQMRALHCSPSSLVANRHGRNRISMLAQSAGRISYLSTDRSMPSLSLAGSPPVAGARLTSLTMSDDYVVTALVVAKRGTVVGGSLMYRHEPQGRYSIKRIDVEVLTEGDAA